MKKTIVTILAIIMCTMVSAQTFLNVELTNGVKVSIPFEESPEVSYPSDNTMMVRTSTSETVYEFDEVEMFSYSATTPTGIDAIAPEAKTANGATVISGLKAGDAVQVYSVSGQKLATARADSNGMANIRLNGLGTRTVVVKTPTTSFKIMVK